MDRIKIRELRKEDCKTLKTLMQGLADSLHMSHAPKLSVEDLEKYSFEKNPQFHGYVAELDSDLIGYAIYFHTFASWRGKITFLDELYVTPAFRNKRIGSLLFDAVVKKAKDSESSYVELHVVNQSSGDYYKRKGVVDVTEEQAYHLYRLELSNA